MVRKTVYRYRWHCFQDETQFTGSGDDWRLSPMPTGINRSEKHSGHWSIRWLGEKWTLDFPNGLHRARFSYKDAPHYHIGNKEHKCELSGVVYLASVGQDGSRIIKHEEFPDPPEANPISPDEPDEVMPVAHLDHLPSEGYKPAPMGRKLARPTDGPGQPPIGERIKAARARAGLTQGQAAAGMPHRVTVQYWSDVENGRRSPSLEWLWEAAKALGCNPSTLDERLASKRWPKG